MRDSFVSGRLGLATLTWVGHVDCAAVMDSSILLLLPIASLGTRWFPDTRSFQFKLRSCADSFGPIAPAGKRCSGRVK